MGMALLDYALDEAEASSPRRLWPNLVVGTFLMLDGLKLMVRWSQIDVAVPVFGMIETTTLKVVILMAMGTILVHCRRHGSGVHAKIEIIRSGLACRFDAVAGCKLACA